MLSLSGTCSHQARAQKEQLLCFLLGQTAGLVLIFISAVLLHEATNVRRVQLWKWKNTSSIDIDTKPHMQPFISSVLNIINYVDLSLLEANTGTQTLNMFLQSCFFSPSSFHYKRSPSWKNKLSHLSKSQSSKMPTKVTETFFGGLSHQAGYITGTN